MGACRADAGRKDSGGGGVVFHSWATADSSEVELVIARAGERETVSLQAELRQVGSPPPVRIGHGVGDLAMA